MKKSLLLAALLSLPFTSDAATVALASDSNIALSDGTLMTSGTVKLGYFAPGTDFTLAPSALFDSFYDLVTYNFASANFSTSEVFSTTGTRTNTAGGGSIPYDGSPGTLNTANVPGDIAGGTIYALVYNGATFASSLEIGVFSGESIGWLWTDNEALVQVTDFYFGGSTLDGVVAHIGTASDDPFTNPHRLAAIPEPSRALLGLIGLTGVMFRRRRAKA